MKTLIEMAREAGWDDHHAEFDTRLKRFAELVRADERKKWEDQTTVEINEAVLDEREACAKFCETHQVWVGRGKRGFSEWGEDDFVTGGIHQGMDYASAIRARSNNDH